MADDGEKAVFVGTFLTNGESVALCDEHLVYFCASTLETMTGVDPAPFIKAISEDTTPPLVDVSALDMDDDPVPPGGPLPDPTPPTPLRGRMRAVSSVAPTDGAGEQDETPAEAASATPAT
jgi:hypothetical protein